MELAFSQSDPADRQTEELSDRRKDGGTDRHTDGGTVGRWKLEGRGPIAEKGAVVLDCSFHRIEQPRRASSNRGGAGCESNQRERR